MSSILADFNRLKSEHLLRSEDETGNLEDPPQVVSEIKRMEWILEHDRCVVNFERELASLQTHSEIILRPRLGTLVNQIYIPKFKSKAYGGYMYGGENDETYNNYSQSIEKNHIFGNKERSKDDVILGIESSFDDSAAGLVNSYGDIISDLKKVQWD